MKAMHLEFKSATSNKFWSIELKGNSHTVIFGRAGTKGQTKTKSFASEELAEKSFNKLVQKKLDKGYLKRVTKITADRKSLDRAFKALEKRGFIALHDAGYTLSDAFEDLQTEFENHPDQDSIIGFCVYHRQDVEQAMDGRGLNLGFTTARAKDEEKMGVKIGKMVKKELEKAGLKVEWNGTLQKRIYLPDFDWMGDSLVAKKKQSKKKLRKKTAEKEVGKGQPKKGKKTIAKKPKRKWKGKK